MSTPSHAPTAALHLSDEFIDQLPLPYIELNKNGIVIRVNTAALDLYPGEQSKINLLGKNAWELMASADTDVSFASYCTAMATGQKPHPVRRAIFDHTRQFRTYELHRSLIYDADGNPCGMRILSVDVTDDARNLAETRRSLGWLQSAMAALPEAILLTDSVGFVLYLNHAAEILLGWHASEITGRLIEQVLPLDTAAPDFTPPPSYITALEAPNRIVLPLLDANGHSLSIEFFSSPVADVQTGHITGVVSVLRKR
jgi:PAS domain S-box-containing protein